MKFRSRISVVLIVFLLAVLASPIYIAIITHEIKGLLIILFACLVTISTLFGITYTIEGKKLYVGMFFFFKGEEYDLTKLESISPTRTLLSSPAASLKRIKLDFGVGRPLVISPAAQDLFIEEILKVNPKVKVNL